MDIGTGDETRVAVLRGHDAAAFGILPGDRIHIRYHRRTVVAVADVTHHSIQHGEIGLFDDVWQTLRPRQGEAVVIEIVSRRPAIAAITKKLLGHHISAIEMRSIIEDIVQRRLTAVELTYFVASGYVHPYSLAELVAMVRAMATTGDTFRWGHRKVVDKHSVGGLAGNRTTMVAIPIIAAAGLIIPKTSSRAITSPAGTADTMEVLAPVSFGREDVRRIVRKAGACLIWGGGLSIAPADDLIIRVSRPLSLEPYDKMIVSIMAKKVAMGIRYVVIDMPYGRHMKIPNRRVALEIEKKFKAVAQAFGIKIHVRFDPARQPIGQGVGPALEARDVLRVLQRKDKRPRDLEQKAVALAGEVLELSRRVAKGRGYRLAKEILETGRAWKKMQQIIQAQGGNSQVDANQLVRGAKTYRVTAWRSGRVTAIDNRAIDELARTLGAPTHKLAGVYLHRKLGQKVRRGEKLLTLYSHQVDRLAVARKSEALRRVLTIRQV